MIRREQPEPPCYDPPAMEAKDPKKDPKSVHAMTDAERTAMMSRRRVPEARLDIEIGGDSAFRRAVRTGGRLLAIAAVLAIFVALFFRFTDSFRVALIVVGLMGAYMLVIGRMVEGRADRSD